MIIDPAVSFCCYVVPSFPFHSHSRTGYCLLILTTVGLWPLIFSSYPTLHAFWYFLAEAYVLHCNPFMFKFSMPLLYVILILYLLFSKFFAQVFCFRTFMYKQCKRFCISIFHFSSFITLRIAVVPFTRILYPCFQYSNDCSLGVLRAITLE